MVMLAVFCVSHESCDEKNGGFQISSVCYMDLLYPFPSVILAITTKIQRSTVSCLLRTDSWSIATEYRPFSASGGEVRTFDRSCAGIDVLISLSATGFYCLLGTLRLIQAPLLSMYSLPQDSQEESAWDML